jgi:hypothetical protein
MASSSGGKIPPTMELALARMEKLAKNLPRRDQGRRIDRGDKSNDRWGLHGGFVADPAGVRRWRLCVSRRGFVMCAIVTRVGLGSEHCSSSSSR